MNLIDTMLNIIFPEKCVGCGTVGVEICQECFKKMPRLAGNSEKSIYAVFDYRDKIMKKLIWSLKYWGKKDLAKRLAKGIENKMKDIVLECPNRPILTCIPLSKEKLHKRGFNQAELIALEIWRYDKGLNFDFIPNILVKTKDTDSQVKTKNRAQRLSNIEGCFVVRDIEPILDKTIIIVDDVITTGATIFEARKTLLNSGANTVIGLAVAH